MRTVMRKDKDSNLVEFQLKEKNAKKLSERKERASRLLESWSKVPVVGNGLIEAYDKKPELVENTVIVLENMANEFSKMTEAQVSSVYNGLTPENALRVVRLGYPNSNRGNAFFEFAMETAEDGIWYVSPVYASSKRGVTAGDITHESTNDRYADLTEEEAMNETPNGAVTTFTATLANAPLKPFFVKVMLDGVIVAIDDGAGNLAGASVSAGTVDYTSGAFSVTLSSAPATGADIHVEYVYDYEDPSNYTDLGEVELRLRKVNFKLRSYRLGLSWSKQSELTLGTTLNIDAEEGLIKGAGEELKKARDFEAFKLGYSVAKGNGGFVEFDADYMSAGADNAKAHAQTLNRVFEDSADKIYEELNRGGISSIVAGSQAANYISTYLDGFSDAGRQDAIGIYQIGTLKGRPVFKVPGTSVMPKDEIYTVWENEGAGDHALAFGVLLPMYQSPTLEYKNFNKEAGLAEWGDHRILQSRYLRGIKLLNVNRY